MSTPNGIDRKNFLAGVASWAALTLSGCSEDGDGGGTDAGGGTSSGGTGTGGTMAGGSGGAMTGGSSTGGSAGGGSGIMCTTDTFNGDHSHPLVIPGSHVDDGIHDEPYTLEDGGTGHTHTLMLTAYDFGYLAATDPITRESSTDMGHSHPCTITCLYP